LNSSSGRWTRCSFMRAMVTCATASLSKAKPMWPNAARRKRDHYHLVDRTNAIK
jgi:hypothetical protein